MTCHETNCLIDYSMSSYFFSPDDTQFQRVIWRNSSAKELRVHELLTVSFGTAVSCNSLYQANWLTIAIKLAEKDLTKSC